MQVKIKIYIFLLLAMSFFPVNGFGQDQEIKHIKIALNAYESLISYDDPKRLSAFFDSSVVNSSHFTKQINSLQEFLAQKELKLILLGTKANPIPGNENSHFILIQFYFGYDTKSSPVLMFQFREGESKISGTSFL